MSTINTTNSELPLDQLGRTLSHERVLVGLPGWYLDNRQPKFGVTEVAVDRASLTSHIQTLVKERLGRHAYPKIVDYVDVLPRTEVGKMRRNVLRETGPHVG